jgi:hypothetical protein
MFGGYANGFTSVKEMQPGQTVDELTARTDLSPEKYADYAMEWISAGAQYHWRMLRDQPCPYC